MKKKAVVKDVRFVKREDGTVIDNMLGVIWGATLEGRKTWTEAKQACEKLGKGWRLPTVSELFSLVDRKKYNPAIDTNIFPDTKSSWYWTSELVAGSDGYAWFVNFYDGCVDSFYKYNYNYVRPVRASQ